MRLLRRVGAGLAACWVMRGSTYPKGTYAILFLAACWWTARSAWVEQRLNIADAALLLALGYLMVNAFCEGFRASAATPGPDAG